MAHPIPFGEANNIIGRPNEMTPLECQSVEAFQDGKNCITRWQLTDDDLNELRRNGGKIYLWIIGQTMQPAIIQARSPFTEINK